MAGLDFLSKKIVHQIEENLRTDTFLAKCARDNQGWIRLEFLQRCPNLSTYTYETILQALSLNISNQIELSSFEPRCLRSRFNEENQTVIITGLPSNVKFNDLFEFFNKFYPVKDIIQRSSLSNRCQGIIHVKFERAEDAFAFVQLSKQQTIQYFNENFSSKSHGYILHCQMLNEQKSSLQMKSFSTRLNPSPAYNIEEDKSSNSCLKSTTCATEQILFCQNPNNEKSSKISEYEKEKIIFNTFFYEFYLPEHILKQKYTCIIISALNPSCFTIQLEQDAIEFDRFQREINDFYNTINDSRYFIRREEIQLNLCVISSDEKKIWNRSQILDYHPIEQTVNLFYVDLGTWEEYVPIDRLRHLTERFHKHLVYSITCRLANIQPTNENDLSTWIDDATNQFLAVIENNQSEIEFLSLNMNNCFQTNLFVWISNQHVCVNDYMIHIKKAKRFESVNDDHDGRNSIQSDEQECSTIHPVISLYNRLGEVLQQSQTASISSSNLSSPSIVPKLYVKLIHVHLPIDNRDIPMIFVHYQKMIFMPDFNLVYLLQLINPQIDHQTIERYAFSIRYRSISLSQESDFDVFIQLNTFREIQDCNPIILYRLDFVEYLFQYYHFQLFDILIMLKTAQQVSDISLWFTLDNEFRFVPQQTIIPYRLPFSNRLIPSV